MQYRRDCIAMLLAGGQGSRLYSLTNNVAKPAVSFGSKYKIIDFTLSNCINSGIDTVGVLTQYQPMFLNDYIGNGLPWDMDRLYGGVHVLPPYQAKGSSDWYKGTANAIYQNLQFINQYNPKYVLILSGDHIYNMDYSDLKRIHIEKNADVTIATIQVPIAEASRFGILSLDKNDRITAFDEKPKNPKSDIASMGVYLFNAKDLCDYLIEDAANPNSNYDFGKNIIPKMLADGKRMFAYKFSGYWKDVGTLDSLWEANMDLLTDKPKFDIFNSEWTIHSRNRLSPPIYHGESGKTVNTLVGGGTDIEGNVQNSIIGKSVTIEAGALVKDSLVFDNVVIKKNAVIDYAIIDENCLINDGAKIGSPRESGKGLTVIARNKTISANTVIESGLVEEDK